MPRERKLPEWKRAFHPKEPEIGEFSRHRIGMWLAVGLDVLWKSFGCALGVGAVVLATMSVACGIDGTGPASGAGDPWAVTASKDTQSAIGVQTWGFRMTEPGTLSVRGYDGNNRQVVEVRQRITEADPYHWALDVGVARANSVATVHLALESRAAAEGTEVSVQVANDTLRSNAAARKIIDRLRADANASKATSITAQGWSLSTNSLRPTDLANGEGGNLTPGDGDDKRLTNDGDDAGQGNGGNGGGDGNDGNGNNGNDSQSCQSSNQCGGDMMSGLKPVLDLLSSSGQGLSSIVGLYECMNADAGASSDAGAPTNPVVLPQVVTCAFKAYQDSNSGNQQAGSDGQDSQLTSLLEAFGSMQSMGQNCNCPQ